MRCWWLWLMLGCLTSLASARDGVTVTVTYPDGKPVKVAAFAAYRAPTGDKAELKGETVAPGTYVFKDIPAESTAVSVLARLDTGRAVSITRKQWRFTDRQASRMLTMTVERHAPLIVRVVNAHGDPLPNAPLRGVISYTQVPLWPQTYWKDPLPTMAASYALVKVTTDAHGQAMLGSWPARAYTLRLFAWDFTGDPVSVTLKPGKATTARFWARDGFRPVAHPACDVQGKALPGVTVQAAYCWEGKVFLNSTVADAQGMVRWPSLPPVRVVVWGDGMPPGLIAPRLRETEERLPPPPASKQSLQLDILFSDHPIEHPFTVSTLLGVTGPGKNARTNVRWLSAPYGTGGRRMPIHPQLYNVRLMPGSRVDLLAVTDGSPVQSEVRHFIAPYPDLEEHQTMTLSLKPACDVRVRPILAAGWSVTSCYAEPIWTEPALPQRIVAQMKEPFFWQVEPDADGLFRLRLPLPGRYRLHLDVATPDGATKLQREVTVQVGEQAVEVGG